MRLSIITINLNNQAGLAATIQSVIAQQFNDYEFIVIDGGSTDGSVEIIKQNEKYVTKWLSEKDTGIYNAMNKGIKLALGQYAYFLNSGDRLVSPDTLKEVFAEIGTFLPNKFAMFFGKLIINNEAISEMPVDIVNWQYVFYLENFFHHQSAFIKRDLFEKYGLYEEKYRLAGDYDFFLRVLKQGVRAKCISASVAFYDTTGLSSNGTQDYLQEKQVIFYRAYNLFFWPGLFIYNKSVFFYLKELKPRINNLPQKIKNFFYA